MSVIDHAVDVSEILRTHVNGSKHIVSLKSDNKNRITEIVFDKFEHANGFVNELAGNASIAVAIQTCYPINYETNVRLTIKYTNRGYGISGEYQFIDPVITKLPYLELEMKYLQLLEEHNVLKKQLSQYDKVHIVKDGECLSKIIESYLGHYNDSKLLELLKINAHILNESLIHVGERIFIPGNWEPITETPTAQLIKSYEIPYRPYSDLNDLWRELDLYLSQREINIWISAAIKDKLEEKLSFPTTLKVVVTKTNMYFYDQQRLVCMFDY